MELNNKAMKNVLYILALLALPLAASAQVFDTVTIVNPEFFPLIDVNEDQGFRIPFRRTAQNRAVLFSDIVGYIDTTITSNIQTLVLSNDTLYISDGNNVILEPYNNEVLDLYTSNDTLFLSTADGLFFTAGTGDITGGTNIGGGAEVFKQKTGANLEFRTLVTEGGLEAVQTDTTIIIRAVYLFFANDAAAGGGGVPVGNPYKLDLGNSYGMPYGTLRIRIE